jgi:hypothetical protein
MAKRSNALSGSGGRGGGPGSRSLSNVTTYFGGRPSDRVSPGGVSQMGSAMGNKATDSGGRPLPNPASPLYKGNLVRPGQPEMGNTLAAATVCGPGGSRTIDRTGGQGQHGPVAGSTKPAGKDILNSFGPDSPIVSERK